jgi:hypothetical protein
LVVRRAILVGLVSLAAMLAEPGVVAAGAAAPRLTIHLVMTYSGPSVGWRGTFTSTSTNGKTVTGVAQDRARYSNGAEWFMSRTLVDKAGTLRFRIEGPYRVTVATLTWKLVGATGIYAGLSGTGIDVEHMGSTRVEATMKGVPTR